MGIFDRLFGKKDRAPARPGLGIAELARRVGLTESQLRGVQIRYRAFTVPKRSGGTRTIHAPEAGLKKVQRRILHRVLARLRAHPAAHGFEHGRSIVTNARGHVGRAVVVRMDIQDFFPSITVERIGKYFLAVGWDTDAAGLLTRLCAHEKSLPQGAPTSPRLSNLVNWELDGRLGALAEKHGAVYTRYADDLTFSFEDDDPEMTHALVGMAAVILKECGYRAHMKKKLTIRRAHQQQKVTGLVVNERVNLTRATRRWLRAVDHHSKTGKHATLTQTQRAGWSAFEHMVETQGEQKP